MEKALRKKQQFHLKLLCMWLWFIVHKSDNFNRFRSTHTDSEWLWENAVEINHFTLLKCIAYCWYHKNVWRWISERKKTNKQTNTYERENPTAHSIGMTRALCGISLNKQKQRKKCNTKNEINDKEYKFRYYWRSGKKIKYEI